MSVWKMRPPQLVQGVNTCWAAALSSFGRVTGGVPNWMSVSAVQKFIKGKDPTLVQSDGSLVTIEAVVLLRAEYKLSLLEVLLKDPVTGAAPATRIAAKHKITNIAVDQIDAGVIQPRLRKSHVIAIYARNGDAGLAHWVVIYGASGSQIFYMDPLSGKLVQEDYLDFGAPADRFLLLWKE